MTDANDKLRATVLATVMVFSVFAGVSVAGTVAAAGNTEGLLSGGSASEPTATQSNPAVVNMPTAVVAQNTDADVTVGWDFSPLSGSYGTGPTELHVYRGGTTGTLLVTKDISSYSGTTSLTLPSSEYSLSSTEDVTLALYNPNVQGNFLASDSKTLEVRSVDSAPAIDMRNFETKDDGSATIDVGYNMKGSLAGGDTLKIRVTWPDGSTTTTSDLSGDPKGATSISVPAGVGSGGVAFELHKNGVDGTPEATASAQHTLQTYISAQNVEYVNGTEPTVGNIGIQSQAISFGQQGGMFQFTLVDSTKSGYGKRDLSGSSVGADESTLVWVNFTVENYSPDVLMGPGDVETWQYSTSGGTADIDILVHPTSVYRYSGTTGFSPSKWKSKWDMADYGLDASVSLAVADIPSGLGTDLNGARLNTDAQFYTPPQFSDGKLKINVAAPHCKDNATGNSCSGGAVNDDGFYTAVIPKSFWSNKWGSDLEADDLAGTYTTGGNTEDLNMQVTKRPNGDLVVNVTDIHYSDGTIELEEDTTAPTADAGSAQSVSVGESVSFDGTASSDNRQIASYEWDVDGDGTYELTGATPSHSYSSSGDRTVTLRVTDGNGNTATDTLTVSVSDTGTQSTNAGSGGEAEPVEVTVDGGQANVHVREPSSQMSIGLRDVESGTNVSTNALSFDTDATDEFTLNVSVHDDAPGGTPAPDATDVGTPLGFVQVDHSIGDAALSDPTMRFSVSWETITGGVDEEELVLYRYHDGEWVAQNTTIVRYTSEAVVLEADLDGMSVFAVGTERAPALGVSAASVENTTVAAGDAVTVSTTVTNTGTATGSTTVGLDVDGAVSATATVALAPGESKTVDLTTTLAAAGTYDLAVNGTAAGSVTVEPAATPTATATPAPTPTPTATVTPTATATPTPAPTPTPTAAPTDTASADGPGFGAGLALVAVALTALAFARRRR